MLCYAVVNKTSAMKVLERPGWRWLAAAGASAAETWAARRPTIVQPLPGGVFLHRHTDGVIVLPQSLSRRTPRRQRAATRDIFCFEYTPRLGDTVLDIGAGCGEEAVTFSQLVGPAGRVICIEGHPATYQRLALACELNDLHNVEPLHLAVADRETTVMMDDGTPGSGSISAAISGRGCSEVRALTIDRVISHYNCSRIDLLKMNIEGAEQLAVRGMSNSAHMIRHVVISCHDFLLGPESTEADRAWFGTYETVTRFLRDMGFRLAARRPTDRRPEIPFYVYASRY